MIFFKIIKYLRSIPNRFKKVRIRAVHDEDLITILDSIGITEQFKKGEYKCMFCNKKASIENLWALKIKDKKIYMVCSDTECINKII